MPVKTLSARSYMELTGGIKPHKLFSHQTNMEESRFIRYLSGFIFRFLRCAFLASAFVLLGPGSATSGGTREVALQGRITNPWGAAIPGATVAAITRYGRVRFSVTDAEGRYAMNGLGPGKYVVWAWAKDYALYDNSNVEVKSLAKRNLDIQLLPELERVPARVADGAASAVEDGWPLDAWAFSAFGNGSPPRGEYRARISSSCFASAGGVARPSIRISLGL